MDISTIAIDGPAASGKSTVGRLLADDLGYLYFDTGVMYRAVAWAALDRGIPVSDEAAVTRLADALDIRVLRPTADDGRQYTVLADGCDVTWKIREAAVEREASPVATYPGVRRALTEQQRRIGAEGRVVMVGRDIGTVVLPNADLKIYLDAAVEERARRRHLENETQGRASDYDEVLAHLQRRDRIDSTRKAAPLRQAPDAVYVDTTHLGIEEVVRKVRGCLDDARQDSRDA